MSEIPLRTQRADQFTGKIYLIVERHPDGTPAGDDELVFAWCEKPPIIISDEAMFQTSVGDYHVKPNTELSYMTEQDATEFLKRRKSD